MRYTNENNTDTFRYHQGFNALGFPRKKYSNFRAQGIPNGIVRHRWVFLCRNRITKNSKMNIEQFGRLPFLKMSIRLCCGFLSTTYLLISKYIDDLIKQLRRNRSGCWVNGDFMGVIVYADDIVLLSPTLDGLQGIKCMAFLKKKRNLKNLALDDKSINA